MAWPIIIAEDDDDVREGLAEVFAARGFDVTSVRNGREVFDHVRRTGGRPALILLDRHMPVMDGTQFLAAQAGEPLLARVPVIMLTGVSDPMQYARPVVAAVAKPVRVAELLAIVDRALHSS